jgi:hypothetical protein
MSGHAYLLVTPGTHRIELTFRGGVGDRVMEAVNDLDFTFQAGHVYIPLGILVPDKGSMDFLIEDKGTQFSVTCLPYMALREHGHTRYYELNGCP